MSIFETLKFTLSTQCEFIIIIIFSLSTMTRHTLVPSIVILKAFPSLVESNALNTSEESQSQLVASFARSEAPSVLGCISLSKWRRFVCRHSWAHLPAASEDEAGQEPIRGGVRHRPGAADARLPRRLGGGAGGGAEDRHVLAEAPRLRLLRSQLGVLEPRRRGEKHGSHAAGPGGDQDSRYGTTEGTMMCKTREKRLTGSTFNFAGDQSGECRAHGNLGSALFSKSSYREALAHHRNQLVLAMKLKDREVCLHCTQITPAAAPLLSVHRSVQVDVFLLVCCGLNSFCFVINKAIGYWFMS